MMSRPTEHDLRQDRHKALAQASRRHLLRILEDAGSPLPVATLAELIDLHPNTVRGHLNVLEGAGLVEREYEGLSTPGRPRALYSRTSTTAGSPDSEGYRFLSEILASLVTSVLDDPAAAAEEVGKAWGRYLVERPAPFSDTTPDHIVGVIVDRLLEFGFEPEIDPVEHGAVIRLHDCPFREVARARQDVICSVHLGLLRGMAEELGEGVTVKDLQPFVEPSLCLADIEFSRA